MIASSTKTFFSVAIVLVGLAAGAALAQTSAAPPPAVLTPAQLAFVKAETKKANDLFVQRVVRITGATEAQVRRALPDEKRITDRTARLISALEHDLKRTLSEEQKAAILAAEDDRRQALATATAAARAR